MVTGQMDLKCIGAIISMILLLILGASGVLESFLKFDFVFGWSGWLFWALILYFFIKIKHPPVANFEKLNAGRIILSRIIHNFSCVFNIK